jgi:hypothetical protein
MPEEHRATLDDIDEPNEQICVVLGQVPNWFLRWGTVAIFLCLLAMVTLCWYIKYPAAAISSIPLLAIRMGDRKS